MFFLHTNEVREKEIAIYKHRITKGDRIFVCSSDQKIHSISVGLDKGINVLATSFSFKFGMCFLGDCSLLLCSGWPFWSPTSKELARSASSSCASSSSTVVG